MFFLESIGYLFEGNSCTWRGVPAVNHTGWLQYNLTIVMDMLVACSIHCHRNGPIKKQFL